LLISIICVIVDNLMIFVQKWLHCWKAVRTA